MKPNFALGLTQDGITLWQRDTTGWLRVGAVALDAADLDVQMQGLAKVAAALAPDGVLTKLVVPDDQILICDLPVAARNREMQSHEIRAQLSGRTPYPVEELDFDWTVTDGTAHVAVVARETLVEAEDFARNFGLNPVCAVAAPGDGGFAQEVFFGLTRGAREILGDVSRLERDTAMLKETGIARLPEPELVPTAVSETIGEAALATKAPAPESIAAPEPEAPKDESPKPVAVESKAAISPGQAAAVTAQPVAEKRSAAQGAPSAKERAASGQKPIDVAKPRLASELADAAVAAGTESAEPAAFRSRRATLAPVAPTAAPAKPAPRAPAADTPALAQGLRTKFAEARALSQSKLTGLTKALSAVTTTGKQTSLREDKRPDQIAAPGPESKATDSLKPAVGKPAQPVAKKTTQKANKSGYPLDFAAKPKLSSQTETAARKDPLETLKARSGSGNASGMISEAERMTIFGARGNDLDSGDGPKRALMILGGVGLLLVAAGIWAFYFMSRPSTPAEDLALSDPAGLVETPATLDPDMPATSVLDETDLALLPADDIEAALGLEDAAQQRPIDASEPEGAETVAQATSDLPAQIGEAPTVDFEQAGGRVAGLRASGLLPPNDPVALPQAPAPPAPFDPDNLPPTRSELAALSPQPPSDPASDPVAAPDGEPVAEASTAPSDLPEGEAGLQITVTEGTPPAVPPAPPEAVVAASAALAEALAAEAAAAQAAAEAAAAALAAELAAQEAEAAATAQIAAEAEGTEPDLTDPLDESALEISVTQGQPAATPPERPEGLAPERAEPDALVPADAEDAATDPDADQAELLTPPPGGVALSILRPASRPEAIVAAASVAAEPEPEFDASELAVAASVRPNARPSQFATVVQRALRAAQPRSTTPAPAAIAAAAPAAAAPAPAPAAQPARAAVPSAPQIPSSGNVAREATQARAINLRQVNLIGVMGTSTNRRALVRLSNGRVVTVRVGDNLDSGRVTAIGNTELRYTRRGRDVVLRIAS